MSRRVELKPAARRELARLSRPVATRIVEAVEELADDPRPAGCVKLKGSDAWRVRVGDYRIVYRIDDDCLIVLVIKIGHRRDVYRD